VKALVPINEGTESHGCSHDNIARNWMPVQIQRWHVIEFRGVRCSTS